MEFLREERFYQKNEDGDTIAEIKWKQAGDDKVDATHTFVDPSLRGQGIAEKLVDRLAEEMRKEGKTIIPTCPYIEKLFERKPEKYADVAAEKEPKA